MVKDFNIDVHYHRMRKGYLVYSFRSRLNREIMQVIFQDIEKALKDEPENKVIRKRTFNVLVELIQNIYNYTSSLSLEASDVLIIVQRITQGYEIITGNFLVQEGVNSLESRLRLINYLTQEQLDEVYRGVLASDSAPKETGAGLGLLDVVRKSGSSFDFKINAVEDGFNFFTLKSLVKVI